MTVLGLFLGLLVGITLGLLGGGGSVLTVPIFVYVLHVDHKPAIAMSLAVVGITSLVGAFRHARAGNINLRTALVFGAFAMTASFMGGRLSHYIPGELQLTIFAAVMLVASVLMFRGRRDSSAGTVGDAAAPMRLRATVLPAVGVGMLTGLIGVGGGFLIIPALVLLGRVPMKQAIGTSLLVIAMTATAGFAGQLSRGVLVDWVFMATFAAFAVTGILVGAALVPRIPQDALRKAFALFLVVVAVLILYQNSNVFLGH